MLVFTKEKPKVGDTVGYREKYDTGINGFLPVNIGTIKAIEPQEDKDTLYEVEFPDVTDKFYESQLVLIKE